MKILFKIILLLLILSVKADAQTVTWSKWFDYSNYDNSGQDVIQTYDGGYLAVGINYNFLNNSTLLIKTNPNGVIEWEKVIDQNTTQGIPIICNTVQQSNDSGFILSGQSFSDSAVLIKTNKVGNIVWIKKYSKPGAGAKFFDHKITLDGGIIAYGQLFFSSFKAFVVKTDSTGNIEWDSSYSLVSTEILQSNDSNYYFISLHNITKINKYGEIIWISGLGNIGSAFIQNNPEEIYSLYTGNDIDSMLLNKIDSSGNLVWRRSYFPVTRSHSICFSKEGRILLAAFKDTLKQFDIITAKVDLNGNLIYRKRIIAFTGNLFMYPNSVKATNDNGFIFTGPTDYPNQSYRDNVFILKTDSQSNTPLFTGVSISNSITQNPSDFQLFQNYPNPFNPATVIRYSVIGNNFVSLKIYDVLGKLVATLVNEKQDAGIYSIEFNGSNLTSGVYYYQIQAGDFVETKRMLLLK